VVRRRWSSQQSSRRSLTGSDEGGIKRYLGYISAHTTADA
jgi:hypothetical protein